MTHLTFSELDSRGLSAKLWKGFNPPEGGIFSSTQSGNPAFGIFDDFFNFSETTGTGGYVHVETTNGKVAQVASDGKTDSTGMGICRLLTTAENDSEALLAYGNVLDAPFNLGSTYGDLAFECRVKISDITTSSHGFFIGLGSAGAAVTVQTITAADAIYATADFLGYQQLKAETTAVDGMYQVSGETKVDGAVNTDLDTLATIGITDYVKLGFRYNSRDRTVDWFVDGTEDTDARLTVKTIEAADADSFPDGSFMTPVACVMNDGTTACNLDIDWWACAQMV